MKQGEKRQEELRNRLRNHKLPMSVASEYEVETAMILQGKYKSGKLLFSWLSGTGLQGKKKKKGEGSWLLELAQMGRDHHGGSCWVPPTGVRAQAGTGCSVIGNVSLTHTECRPQVSHSNSTH